MTHALAGSLLVLSTLVSTPPVGGAVGEPVIVTDSPAAPIPSPTETVPPPPEYQKITVNYSIDNNFNGKADASEKASSIPSGVGATLKDKDGSQIALTTQKGRQTGKVLEDELDSASFVSSSAYTLSSPSNIIDVQPYLKKNGYVFNVLLRPVVSFDVEHHHTADGKRYTVYYQVTNTGEHPIEVKSSLHACRPMKIEPQKSKNCEVSSGYYMREKELVIPNNFTATYKGHVFDTKGTSEEITEKSPELKSSEGKPDREGIVLVPHDDETPTEAPAPQTEQNQDKGVNPWLIVGLIVLALTIAGIITYLIIRKRRQKRLEEQKAKDDASTPPDGSTGASGAVPDDSLLVPEGENSQDNAVPLKPENPPSTGAVGAANEPSPVDSDSVPTKASNESPRPPLVVRNQESEMFKRKPKFVVSQDYSEDDRFNK